MLLGGPLDILGFRLTRKPFYLDYHPDPTQVLVDIGLVRVSRCGTSRDLICEVADHAKAEDIDHCVNDLVVPKLLAMGGEVVLHGGCVATPDRLGFCLIGPSGYGKSTLTASFRSQGLDILADDSVQLHPDEHAVIARGICANPRLLPDSLAQVFPDPVASQPVVSYTAKRRVQLPTPREVQTPIAAIFLLAAPEIATDAVTLSPLSQAAACMALVAHSFAFDPSDPTENRRRFAFAAQLARRIPVLELSYPRDYARLPEVQATILQYLENLQAEPART